jgi:hypothetical protein
MSDETATTTDATKDMIRARSAQVVLIQDSKGLGTGVVVGADGWVLTNKHVAPSVGPFRVILANGSNVTGVGFHQSPHHDLAVVKVASATPDVFDLERDVTDDFHVGEEVFALGHPRGCRFSVSRGIISNPHREFEKEYFVQTDVSINPGNSGGPLVDRHGRLVGIVTMSFSYSQGLGFAVPGYTAADYVRYVRRLVRQGVVKIPAALLEHAASDQRSPEEIVRGAIDALAETGKASIEEEKAETGLTKLRRRNALVDVTCKDNVLTVTGRVATVGPAERRDAVFLEKLLKLNGGSELGGASFTLRDNEIHIGLSRPTTGLDGLQAFWAVDLVSHLVDSWGGRIAGLFFEQSAITSPVPEYPTITLPEPPSNDVTAQPESER